VKRLLLVLGLILFPLLTACSQDPETRDLKNYVQVELFNIRTNLRAARDQYESSRSKNDLARSNIIRTKVLYQYERYLKGLQAIKTDTAYVEELNAEGIKLVSEAMSNLDDLGRAMLQRDAHLTTRARMDAEAAIDKVEKWQARIWEDARARKIDIPSDNVR